MKDPIAETLAYHLEICSTCCRAMITFIQATKHTHLPPSHPHRVRAMAVTMQAMCPLGRVITESDAPKVCAQA